MHNDNELCKIQRDFLESIFDPAKNYNLKYPERLKVYAEGILSGRINALKNRYPATVKLVGDDYFRQLAKSFALKYIPKLQDLNQYGQEFSAFCREVQLQDPNLAKINYLPELINFENYLHIAHYSQPDPIFDFAALAKIDPEEYNNLRLKLSQSLKLIESTFPLEQIRQACLQDSALTIEENKIYHFVIWRKGFLETALQIETDLEWKTLSAIYNQSSLGEILELDPNAADVLPKLIESGCVVGF